MYKGKKVFVVAPAWNEEKLIGEVIKGMPDFVDHLIVINDASPDSTADVVRKINDPKTILLENEKNMGVGFSVRRGIKHARDMGAQAVIIVGGDNQMDPKYMPDLLDPLVEQGYDYAKGNRFYSRAALQGMPRHRIFGSIILTFMTRIASGYWNMFDSQNGYYVLGERALRQIDFDALTKGYPLENDMLINLNILGLRTKDVPIPAKYGTEVSSMKLAKIIPQFSIFLFKGFFRRIWRKYVIQGLHPVAIFMFFGSLLFIWGLGFGIWIWATTAQTGVAATTGTVMLSVLPLLMGFELLLWAFVLDVQEGTK